MRTVWLVLCAVLLTAPLVTAPLGAQCDPGNGLGGNGPDVMVGDLTSPLSYGTAGGYYAYSCGTTSCNIGTAVLQWISSTNFHPVIAQNMYRMKNGRFEQIGMSWLKHGFAALTGNICGCTCQNPGTSQLLGVGCSDPYGASLNGSQGGLGPRSEIVDPAAGIYLYPPILDPVNTDLTWRRLRVHGSDLDAALNPGALYFVEGHYITPDDHQNDNGWNNASYRQISVATDANRSISYIGTTQRQLPAIQAWQDQNPSVTLVNIPDGEGGLLVLGYTVTDLGAGEHAYEYALYNMNSTRSVRSFQLPLPGGVSLTDLGFHDVEYHSGEPYSGADWAVNQGAGSIEWATETFAQNQNANAVRWGTLYNFRFIANAPPVAIDVTLGLFEPGVGNTLTVPTLGPSGDFTLAVTGLSCTIDLTEVDLAWTNAEPYDSIEITRDGAFFATLGGGATSFSDLSPAAALHTYGVNAIALGVPSGPATCDVDFPFPLTVSLPGGPVTEVSPAGGDVIAVQIDVTPGFTILPGTESLWIDTGTGYFSTPLAHVSGNQYDATFPSILCGTIFPYYVSATANTGLVVSFPAGGPSSPLIAASALAFLDTLDELESAGGWLVGPPNDATTGTWTFGNPNGTAAQPEDDHTPTGVNCWFTGQGTPGGASGTNDVDGGTTTLYTSFLDLSGASDPEISYWRWYSNDSGAAPNEDVMLVEVSGNGLDWVEVETVGPAGPEASGEWFEHTFRVLDLIGLSPSTQVRFQVSDLLSGSIVEGAIDDFRITDLDCSFSDCNGNGMDDTIDLSSGTSVDCNVNGIPDECDIAGGQSADCDLNGVPDICDIALGAVDCDGNGVPDSCEIAAGGDCDSNGLLDACEIAGGTATDCDANGAIDSCDIAGGAADCDTDGGLDSCQIAAGTALDCNTNGAIDSCDIAGGGSQDLDLDGIPDECQALEFVRGDANGSGTHDISDAVAMLSVIFAGVPTTCQLALDANADGSVNIADPVRLLGYLFSGDPGLSAPFPGCGPEPVPSGISCDSFPVCP